MKKLTITMPVKNRAWILPYTLKSLRQQSYPAADTTVIFYDDGSVDGSGEMLAEWCDVHRDAYDGLCLIEAPQDGTTHDSSRTRGDRTAVMKRLARIRQRLLEEAKGTDCELWCSVDSDTLLGPTCLEALAAHEKPVISTILFTDGHQRRTDGFWPREKGRATNAGSWRVGTKFGYQNFTSYEFDALYEVFMAGGLYLVRREVMEKPVGFDDKHMSIAMGEDIAFFASLQEAKVGVWLDTTVRAIHVMCPPGMQNEWALVRGLVSYQAYWGELCA